MKDLDKIYSLFTECKVGKLKEFFIDFEGKKLLVGYLDGDQLTLLEKHFKDTFIIEENEVYLSSKYSDSDSISSIFDFVALAMNNFGVTKLRNEHMELTSIDGKIHLGKIERSIIHLFGCRSVGIHINAFVEKDNRKYMWIAKRASHKVDPLKLDNLVAGAVSFGYSVYETVTKEAQEEASISHALLKEIKNTAIIRYKVRKYGGLRNDEVNIFSLKLPDTFVPRPLDNEVERFYLLDCKEIADILLNNFDLFKYNSGLVALHFLMSNHIIYHTKIEKLFRLLST